MPRRNYPKNNARPLYLASSTLDIAYPPDAACRSKRRFSTEKIAQREIDRKELLQPALSLTTYECPWCHGWHLTRQPRDY